MKAPFLATLAVGLASQFPQPVLAGSVCVETPNGSSCYCSGLGCRRFCRDILTTGQGGGSNSGSGELGLAVAPSRAPSGQEIAGLFDGPVIVRAPGFQGDTAAVAILGPQAEIDAGRGTLFVLEEGEPVRIGEAETDQISIVGNGALMTMKALSEIFEPAELTLAQ